MMTVPEHFQIILVQFEQLEFSTFVNLSFLALTNFTRIVVLLKKNIYQPKMQSGTISKNEKFGANRFDTSRVAANFLFYKITFICLICGSSYF